MAPAEFGSMYAYAAFSGMHASTAMTATMPRGVVRFIALLEQGLYPSSLSLAEAAAGRIHRAIELQHGLIIRHRRALPAVDGDGGKRPFDVSRERLLAPSRPVAGELQDLPQDALRVRLQRLEIDPQHLFACHLRDTLLQHGAAGLHGRGQKPLQHALGAVP